MLVLVYHVTLWGGLSRSGALGPLASELKAGVAVFFVISGALLYLPYARAIRAGAKLPSVRDYARRRLVRVGPAYWVALTVVAVGPFGAGVLTPDVWRYYGLTQIYEQGTLFSGLGVSWSLAVEISFYAALPLLAIAVAYAVRGVSRPNRNRAELAIIAALAAGSLGLRVLLAGSPSAMVPNKSVVAATALPALMDWFAIGLALAVVAAEWEAGGSCLFWLASLARKPGLCWLLASACFAAGIPFQHGDLFPSLYGPVTHVAIGLGAGFFVLPAVAASGHERSVPIRLLTHPVAVWLGTVSFGIYLWHVPVLYLIHGPFTPGAPPLGPAALLGLLATVVVGAVALGAASWYAIERPILTAFGTVRSPGSISTAMRPIEMS